MKGGKLLFFVLTALLISTDQTPAQFDTVRGGRFYRGGTTNASYHSLVIPFDFQKGFVCADTGGLAPVLLPYLNSSPLLYHYNAAIPSSSNNLDGRIPFRNPIVAFGSEVGGSPMYIGQQYRFGVYAGAVSDVSFALRQHTWIRTSTNVTYVGVADIDLPYTGYTNLWLQFQTNGYTQTVTTNGLTTIIGFENTLRRWDVNNVGTFVLTHIADTTATNKIYQIELVGTLAGWPMVADDNGQLAYSPLYTLEFEYRPPWRSVFVDQPHFAGEPVPSAYVGTTLDELLTNGPVATVFSLSQGATTYTNLDHSPELRRHPILDQFVSDLRRDPVALARFVHNEIELTDAISYNDNGSADEVAVTPGGVSRGALATFQEGQGSPAEQCALLVYLLRQAGIPAVYLYPPHSGLKLLDTQLSKLLRLQLHGVLNSQTKVYTTNQVIPVNYPWVAAYIGTNWVHLFPWMKDTELVEGLNLYDYMPEAYNNGFKWMRDYALGKTNILSLAGEDDTPLAIYPKFLQNQLNVSAPGVSLDDIGFTWRNRRKSYARWEEFPQPFVAPTNGIALDTLSSSGITNVYAGLTNIFDTISVEAYSTVATNKKVWTGELRLVDLHNRRLLLRHVKTGADTHSLIFSLAAFRTNATGPTNFTTGDALINAQQMSTNLASTDDTINLRTIYKRHRAVPQSVATNLPVHWFAFPGLSATLVVTADQQIKKGDLAAICLDYGRVSRAMLNVHAQELWNMEALLKANPSATNSISPDLYQGAVVNLMGMSYYERRDRFRELDERLHKERMISQFAHGLAHLSAKRVGGALPNQGEVILVQPKLDMNFQETVVVNNHTLHPDSGADDHPSHLSYSALKLAEGSAEEHHVINAFFQQSNSISTIKLLQLAQQRVATGGSNVVILNAQNYETQGNIIYQGTPLKSHDAGLWPSITNFLRKAAVSNLCVAFVTPGAVSNAANSYKAMGALLFSAYGDTAGLIGQNLNGGIGPTLPDNSFTALNTLNYALQVGPDGNYSLVLTPSSAGSPTLAPDAFAAYNAAAIIASANAGSFNLSEFQNAWNSSTLEMLGLSSLGSLNLDFGQSLQAVEGNAGQFGWLGDGLSQILSSVSDPVHAVTGEFYVHATDLTLPGPMSLAVRRNYSSLNLADNQFGFGWKLDYMSYLSLNSDGTVIYAAEPGGAVIAYERTATNANVYLPTPARNPQLNNHTQAGIGSTANRLRNRIDKQVIGSETFYSLSRPDGGRRTFKVLTFTGNVSRTRPYLLTWEDHRGNSFTFEYGTDPARPDYAEVRRIQSSNGNYLGFAYDVFGHIIEAYTGDGRRLRYEYDRFGDLVRVTFPDSSTVEYEYEHLTQVVNGQTVPFSRHLLLRENKPDGRVLQNAYDQHRRVTNQWATVGSDLTLVRNATFVYSNNFKLTNSFTNTISGSTFITDVNNKTSRYEYTNGLITKITDPLNQTIEQQWHADNATVPGHPRSLWKKKDQRGLWTEFKYDADGNVTSTVTWGDLTGDGGTHYATNTVAYSTNRLPTELVDPVGNKTVTHYHPQYPFLPEFITRYAGSTPVSSNQFTYYNVTNTFTSGGVTYTNLALGLMKQEIRAVNSPDAATNEWTHDGRGFLTQRTRYTGTGDPNVTHNFFYNERGELVEQTDAAGRKTRFDFDAMGRPILREVFEAGQATPLAWDYSYYNLNGELTWSDGPRYDPEDYVWRDYDGAGRLCVDIRWRSQARADGTGMETPVGDALFATTFRDYDLFGNLRRVMDPRGAVTTNVWNALGWLVQTKSYDVDGVTLLSTEGYGYEPGGQVRYHTNALGGVTETQYTTTGLPKFRRHPDGSTQGWRYYLDGRLDREIQSNGAYWDTYYDDANRATTRSFFSATGTPRALTFTVRDRRGNVTTHLNEGYNPFTNLFDGLDRVKVASGPPILSIVPTNVPLLPGLERTNRVQQSVTNFYDAAAVVMTNVNALGEKTITTTDALGRVTRAEIRNASNAVVRETDTLWLLNHHGARTTQGSGLTKVETFRWSDNAGREALTTQFTSTNRYEWTLRDYDASGNPGQDVHFSSTDGSMVAEWLQSYTYDGLNRLILQSDRDNALTTFARDPMGHVTNQVNPGGLKHQATYNNAGQLLKDWNLGTGSTGARTNAYAYYSSNSPFAGRLQTRTDNRGVVCTSIYNDWLNPTTNTHTGPLAEHNLTTIRVYEMRQLVLSYSENFADTNTGPATVLRRIYNAYGQITSETLTVGGLPLSTARQGWDSVGRRLGVGVNAFGFAHTWRADGLLASSTGPTGGGSYTYDTAGQSSTRTVGARTTSLGARDGVGRPLAITNTLNGTNVLVEALTYTGDGLLATHTLTRPDFTDSRAYTFATLSRRLTEERLRLDATKLWTNRFTYDHGAAGGPGVLTRMAGTNSAAFQTSWKGGTDALLRISNETNTVARRPASGRVNGPATVTVTLGGKPMPVTVTGTNALDWRTTLELTPGAHQLIAYATHPSGLFTTNKTATVTNNAADRVEVGYSADGQVTNYVWKRANGTVERTQTLAWDAKGRLHLVTERDSATNGYNWTAVYDALGRRLRTTTIVVTNGVALNAQPKTISQFYDPQVEFLELGVSYEGRTIWKLYGPDLNDVYGGLNGTGGFDAFVPGPELFCPTISDERGNVLAVYDQTHGTLRWNDARPTGYGAVPGYRPLPLGHGADIIQSSAWRGRWVDITGRVNLGARGLRLESGMFDSFDPRWNGRDPSGYTFAGGDPANYFDADGRIGKDFKDAVAVSWQAGLNRLYTGDYAPTPDAYEAATTAAGNWVYEYSPARGGFVGVGIGGKFSKGTYKPAWVAGVEGNWTIEDGFGIEGEGGLGLQMRGRNSLGQFNSQQFGVSLSGGWNEREGWNWESGLYGGSGTRSGGTGFEINSTEKVQLGAYYGPAGFGLYIDPNRLGNLFHFNLPDSEP